MDALETIMNYTINQKPIKKGASTFAPGGVKKFDGHFVFLKRDDLKTDDEGEGEGNPWRVS